MRARRFSLVAALFALALPGGVDARSSGGSPIERRQLPAAGSLLTIGGDRLIAYSDFGRASLRNEDGTWTAELQLPVTFVWAVVPDGTGFLVSGEAADGRRLIVLFDASAVEQRRWVPSEALSKLFVAAGRRWAIQQKGTVELLPDGRLGSLEPFPDARARHYGDGPPLMFDSGGDRWTCWGANVTEAHAAPATCQRTGGERWALRGAGREPPVRCGDWLIEHLAPDYRELGVWSLQGKRVARRRYSSIPVISCAGADALVVGARRIEMAQLPSLRPRWSWPVRGRPVAAVAAVGNAVVYRTEDSSEVVTVGR